MKEMQPDAFSYTVTMDNIGKPDTIFIDGRKVADTVQLLLQNTMQYTSTGRRFRYPRCTHGGAASRRRRTRGRAVGLGLVATNRIQAATPLGALRERVPADVRHDSA